MSFGLSIAGFNRKTQSDIESSIESYIQNHYPNFSIRDESDTGHDQLIKAISSELTTIWEELENLYYANIPSFAEGIQLDNCAEYNAIERIAGIKSSVTVTFTGNSGTIIPEDTPVLVNNTSYRFLTVESATIGESGSVSVQMLSEEYGPIPALSGTLTDIQVAIDGLLSVTNSSSATLGSYEETDVEYRERRYRQITKFSGSTPNSLVENIADIEGVEEVSILINTGATVDGNGLPAKSYCLVVLGGDSDEIASKIWELGGAGIETYGNTTVEVQDSTDRTREVNFYRPDEIDIYIAIELTKNLYFPNDGEAQIKTAIVDYISDNFSIGDDVIRTKLFHSIYSVAGVVSVETLNIGSSQGGEIADDFEIGDLEIASCVSGNISIEYSTN